MNEVRVVYSNLKIMPQRNSGINRRKFLWCDFLWLSTWTTTTRAHQSPYFHFNQWSCNHCHCETCWYNELNHHRRKLRSAIKISYCETNNARSTSVISSTNMYKILHDYFYCTKVFFSLHATKKILASIGANEDLTHTMAILPNTYK